jgi:hypothetical protein
MQALICNSTTTYWIAGDGETVVHFGTCSPGQEVVTGQPAMYATEIREQWIAQLVRLGIVIGEDGEPIPPGA